MALADLSPRLLSGRWWSSRPGPSQADFACRRRSRVFKADPAKMLVEQELIELP
jgi:hypothetical protein